MEGTSNLAGIATYRDEDNDHEAHVHGLTVLPDDEPAHAVHPNLPNDQVAQHGWEPESEPESDAEDDVYVPHDEDDPDIVG
jgi:hypothetical protein